MQMNMNIVLNLRLKYCCKCIISNTPIIKFRINLFYLKIEKNLKSGIERDMLLFCFNNRSSPIIDSWVEMKIKVKQNNPKLSLLELNILYKISLILKTSFRFRI